MSASGQHPPSEAEHGRASGARQRSAAFEPEEARAAFDLVRERHHAGEMTEEDCRAILGLLVFQDDAGELWTPGSETGGWYRRCGQEWLRDEPSGLLHLKVVETGDLHAMTYRCPQCDGALVDGARVCTWCGRPLADAGQVANVGALAARTCGHCGTRVGPGALRCGFCGRSLQPASSPPAGARPDSIPAQGGAGGHARPKRIRSVWLVLAVVVLFLFVAMLPQLLTRC